MTSGTARMSSDSQHFESVTSLLNLSRGPDVSVPSITLQAPSHMSSVQPDEVKAALVMPG